MTPTPGAASVTSCSMGNSTSCYSPVVRKQYASRVIPQAISQTENSMHGTETSDDDCAATTTTESALENDQSGVDEGIDDSVLMDGHFEALLGSVDALIGCEIAIEGEGEGFIESVLGSTKMSLLTVVQMRDGRRCVAPLIPSASNHEGEEARLLHSEAQESAWLA